MKHLLLVLMTLLLLTPALADHSTPNGVLSLWQDGKLTCSAWKADLNGLAEALFGGDPIVTAKHCTSGAPLFASIDGGITLFPVAHVWDGGTQFARKDWAFLLPDITRVDDEGAFADYWGLDPLAINTDRLRLDEDVVVWAHPGGQELMRFRGYVVREHTNGQAQWSGLYVLDVTCNQGCSGAPVLNERHQVVAVMMGGYGVGLGNGRAIFDFFYGIPTDLIFSSSHLHP